MKKWLIVAMLFCLTLTTGELYAWEKNHDRHDHMSHKKHRVVNGGDATARASSKQKQSQKQHQKTDVDVQNNITNEIPVTVTNNGSVDNTVGISVGAPSLSIKQTYKQPPGVVTTQAIAPEVQLYELSKTPVEAGLTGVSRYNYECRPVDTAERPLISREEEDFHGKFYVSFSPHQNYLAIAERIPAKIKEVEIHFPPELVKCLGILFIESNGKGKVTPDQLFSAARNYVREKLIGPYKVYLVPLENSITANRGVVSTNRGFSATGGSTRIIDSLLQATLGIGGTYGSGNAFTGVRIGGTFALVAPSATGIYLNLGYGYQNQSVPKRVAFSWDCQKRAVQKKEASNSNDCGYLLWRQKM